MPERDQHPGNRADEPRVPEGDAHETLAVRGLLTWARAALLILFAAAVVKTAWLSDDAYITLRTIDNFWHGYGLRWNVLERVQTYTHPLWMLIVGVAYGVTREAAYTTLIVSFACTAALLWLVVRRLSPARACLALGLLAASRAFVDFSTSGLENPLSHLLLAAFWIVLLHDAPASARRVATLALLAGLIGITRQDQLLLVAPGVLVESWRLPWRRALPAWIVGAAPLVLWHAFALVYYGFAFPNSAYAKLGTAIPMSTLVGRGLLYLRASFESDPVTLLVIAAGIAAACVHSWRRALAAGAPLLLYLVYVVRIGGDYMNGRFLTALVLSAAIIVAHARWAARPRVVSVLVPASLLLALLMPESVLRPWVLTPPPYGSTARYGIMNEQADFVRWMGLIPMLRGARPSLHPWGQLGQRAAAFPQTVIHTNVGLVGYYGGPKVHVIDVFAIGDPLLARLPANELWMVGHYRRPIPAWYQPFLDRCVKRLLSTEIREATCLAYVDELQPPDAAVVALYRDLLLVTAGPVWSLDRWRTIVRLNLRRGTLSQHG